MELRDLSLRHKIEFLNLAVAVTKISGNGTIKQK